MIKVIDTISNKVVPFKTWNFPGGEVGVKIDSLATYSDSSYMIRATGILSSDELVVIRQLVDAINNANSRNDITLYMPYFPYARQDRVCNPGESFALRVFAESFFSNLKIDRFVTMDLHSRVSSDMIESYCRCNYTEISQVSKVAPIAVNYDYLIFPDDGAAKKVNAYVYQSGIPAAKFITARKVRKDGGITSYVGNDDILKLKDKTALVVDDICDGGATFLGLASVLEGVTSSLDLYVTHGIFSKGVVDLSKSYGKIYTANLMNSDSSVVRYVYQI